MWHSYLHQFNTCTDVNFKIKKHASAKGSAISFAITYTSASNKMCQNLTVVEKHAFILMCQYNMKCF